MNKPLYQIDRFIVGQLQTNCYVLSDKKTKDLIIIDPGDDASYVMDQIGKIDAHPKAILLTHGHFDHMLAAFELQETYGIPCFLHPADFFLLPRMRSTASHFIGENTGFPPPPRNVTQISGEDTIPFGSLTLEIMETPGHTPGGISLYEKKQGVLFTGDILFAKGLFGDWHHAYSDKQAVFSSVAKLLALPHDIIVYPGHGQETSIGNERAYHHL